MRCDEIQERMVELLYDEQGTPSAGPELRAHLLSCPECRKELEELKGVQNLLKVWKDESPLRPVTVPWVAEVPPRARFGTPWRVPIYAAVALLVIIAFLGLSNAEISLGKGGFSYKSHLFGPSTDYYTKAEVRDILKRALDDSESRMTETNYLMMQRVLDTMEQDRLADFRLVRSQMRGKN